MARSITRTPVWADNPTLFSVMAVESPTNFRAHFALAQFNALGGRPTVADTMFQRALALYPEHVPARLAYGQVLQMQRQCGRALPLFESAMRDDPESQEAVVGTVICLLDLQRFEAARSLALIGNASGWRERRLRDLRTVAESVLVAMDSADVRNRFWRSGRTFQRTGLPLRVDVFREPQFKPRSPESAQSASKP
jgi:tetratricopeptide (TPR) repeat protein